MKDNFEKCSNMLLNYEGGFISHPEDLGGTDVVGKTLQKILALNRPVLSVLKACKP